MPQAWILIIATGHVANPPTAAEIDPLRQRIAVLYNWSRDSDAMDGLIGAAMATA